MVCGVWIQCDDVLMRHALFRAAFLFAMLIPLQACSLVYKAEPIQAWVVDGETNQPLEGVIVVAHWQLKGGLEGGNPVGQMMVMETVTDAKGRFYFPGWGPKPRSLKGRLKTRSPGILLFKSGYEYKDLENELNNESLRGELKQPLRSDWDGKTIKMERFGGTMEEYADHLLSFNISVQSIYRENCEWKNIPRLSVAMHKQEKIFRKEQILNSLHSIEDLPNKGCGSASEFFKEYLN